MATETALVNNALVMRETEKTWRWLDAFGPNVRKWFFDFRNLLSTTTAAGATVTQTNGTMVGTASVTGACVTLTLGGADNDKVEIQSTGEPFKFAAKWPAYFGCRFQVVDADQQDVHLGWTITDTDHAGGVSDGLYFRTVDESAVLSLVMEKDSTESTTAIATLVDATDYTVEMYNDGDYVYVYLNGTLTASVACSNANYPNDEDLCATITNQAGEATANNLRLYWARWIQIQE